MATDLNVKITADDSDLVSGLNDAKSNVGGAASSINESLSDIASSAKKAVAAFAGFEALKSLINTAIDMDSLKMSINAASGSAEKGAQAMEFVRSTAESLGLNLQATAESYKTIAGASMGTALEGEKARDIFLAVSEASSVMGLSSEDAKGALLALGQMISKGTVQSEELKGQLGERIPGAFQLAAKAAGVTTSELQKMLDNGKVISEDFLPKFAQALHERFAKDVPESADSARASMNRFNNSITELKVALAESGILEFAELLARGWSYMASIVSITVKQLASNVVGAFADIYRNYNDVIVGGLLRSSERLNKVLPDAFKIDTTSLKTSYNEGLAFASNMDSISDRLDASATKTATNLYNKIAGIGTGSPSLEGNYSLGGMGGGESAEEKKKREKAAREAEQLAKKIQSINDETTALRVSGLDREEAKAYATYNRELKEVGSTAAGKLAAEKHLTAALDEINMKRLEALTANNKSVLEEQKASNLILIDSAKAVALESVQAKVNALNLEKQYGNITRSEELAELRKIESEKYAIEKEALDKKVALLKEGTDEFAKANYEMIALRVRFGVSIEKIDKEIAYNQKNEWASVGKSIQTSMGTAIGNLINFTTTWKNAFVGLLQSALGSFTQFIGKKVVAWIMGENTMTAATVSANIARVASNAWANITSLAMTVATAIKTIAIYAWQAAAAAYAAIASIPFVGPFLAPVVAAGAVVAVTSMIGNIASAEGGYDIPSGVNPMTQLHQNEMVLPAEHANTIRGLGDMAGGGTNITIHAVDAKSVKQLFTDHGSALVSALKKQGRNFNT